MKKKLYRRLGISVLIMLVCLKVLAQQTVTGIVRDESGSAIPGASVIIKGTSIGTVTDTDGAFKISARPDEIIVISFIGYKHQEILVGQQTTVDVNLTEDVQTLEEIVVSIGYGEVQRKDLTGAISSVRGDELKRTNVSTLEQALQGRVPGMVIQQVSGQPGGGVSVQIRGITSLGGSNPLYVIDGIRISTAGSTDGGMNPLAGINASEIESIEVLKDAASTAIYGAQASDGVILITTKRGKQAAPTVSYQYYTGFQRLIQTLPVLNLSEHATFLNERAAEPTWNFDARPEFANPQYLGKGTDWQGELFRTSRVSEHSISLSGGDEKTRYYLSGTYYQNDGVAFGSKFNRTSVRLNLDNKTTKWLRIGTSLQLVNIDEKVNAISSGVIWRALSMTPDIAVQNSDGSWGGAYNNNGWVPPIENPLALALINKDEANRKQVYANAYVEADLAKGLLLKNVVGGNFSIYNRDRFNPSYVMGNLIKERNDGTADYNDFNHSEMSTVLTYNHSFGEKYKLTAMAGHEWQLNYWRQLSATRMDFPTNTVQTIGAGDPATATNGGGKGQSAIESYFGRLDFGLNDRYLFTGNARYDGNSMYAKQNRWILSYSGALAWKINNESFFEGVKSVDELKLRLSSGLTNRAGGRDYSYASTLITASTGLGGIALVNDEIGNPDLKWEQTAYNNIGLDGAFFNWRINFSVDFYHRKTNDLAMQITLPMYSGTATSGWPPGSLKAPYVNIGSMENKGFDFRISSDNIRGKDLTWRTDLTVSRNRNKITALNAEDASINTAYSRTVPGRSLGEFYGYIVEGVFATPTDVLGDEANGILPHARPVRNNEAIPFANAAGSIWYGDLKFKDLNGDGIIDESDQTYLGSPLPKVQLGLNNTFTYKNFDLNIFFTSNIGNKVYNVTRQTHEDPQVNTTYFTGVKNYAKLALVDPNGSASDINNVYVTNPDTKIPGLRNDRTNGNQRVSDRYVEDGSFVKLKNVSLGYTFSNSLTKKMHLKSLKVYASATNLFIISKYSGMDPEIGSWNPLYAGIDDGYYPQPRIITFGLNLSL
ncbi:SusC/RagA family TonB-linked outer membrane protein [Ohtaekwangia koreensis]|uniref:TonB-linked outer membrane protein, SusC/RagA family n=1 Tax=Ohtaekwangia koreensis TaxID=688867 RepID=A0A1T5KLJ9_9BACT|nr:TonB-dependent receptor [Ohtaekwangia koreensis]SKC64632.1 TonB-linked outer membrane protein, SusC/RagA family [Ohtaekwangia koreensis]